MLAMSILAVIFDVDGVLVDSPHERAWRETLHELMYGAWNELRGASTYTPERFDTELYQSLVAGKPRQNGALAILEYFQVPQAKHCAAVYAQEKQKKLLTLLDMAQFHVFPDACRLCLDCLQMGLPMAAASSSKNAGRILASIPVRAPSRASIQTLRDVFVADVSGRNVPHGKPAPDLFLAAAQEMQVRPDVCLVVEDAVSGIMAAKSGGMSALGVARVGNDAALRQAHADLVVHSLDDVSRDALRSGRLEVESPHFPA